MTSEEDNSASSAHVYVEMAKKFIIHSYAQEIDSLLLSPFTSDEHISFPICFITLMDKCSELGRLICFSPCTSFEILDAALVEAQQHVIEHLMEQMQGGSDDLRKALESRRTKNEVHCRLRSFPWLLDPSSNPSRPTIGDISSHHLGKLITVAGTVTKSSQIKQVESKKIYRCLQCKRMMARHCRLEEGGNAQPPDTCDDPGCLSSTFELLEDHRLCLTGLQEIRVQEKIESLSMGCLPRSIPIFLKDDLVDKAKPGEDVETSGVVIPRWPALKPGERCVVELVMIAHDIRLVKKRGEDEGSDSSASPEMSALFEDYWKQQVDHPMTARDHIVNSICPHLHGLKIVKLSVLLMLLGGVPRNEEGSLAVQDQSNGGLGGGEGRSRVRGDIHMLLIGDPGLGKSQLMRFAAMLSHRSVVANGRGVTSAGLTATAVKESGPSGQWILEAGALVLADGGLCVIDEFEGIPDGSSGVLHEAMEQQTVHVAKAGIVATLSTRASILAATNPKKGWAGRAKGNLSDATNISGPLLSRFDIVLVLSDVRNHKHDLDVASHILSSTFDDSRDQQLSQCWSVKILKSYIQWATQLNPIMDQEAESIILTYYQSLRQSYDRNSARTTIRALESLVRVATAHARLMGRQNVNVDDAVVSVMIAEVSLDYFFVCFFQLQLTPSLQATQHSLGVIDPDSTVLDSYGVGGAMASDDPEKDYYRVKRKILVELGIGSAAGHGVLPVAGPGHSGQWRA